VVDTSNKVAPPPQRQRLAERRSPPFIQSSIL
jgi:hypothetical protein